MEESILFLFYVIVFLWLIRLMPFFRIDGLPRIYLAMAYVLKLLAGLAMVWIYSHYYTNHNTSDIYLYYRDTEVLFNAAHSSWGDYLRILTGIDGQHPALHPYYAMCNLWWSPHDLFINNYRTLLRINTFVRLFSFGHMSIHVVFFSFLSFLGLTAMLKALINYARDKVLYLYMAVFLVPSVLFWSSGILKESPIIFALGFAILAFWRITAHKRVLANGLLFIVMLWLILMSKVYLLFVLLIPFVLWYWTRGAGLITALKRFLLLHGFLLIIILLSSWMPGIPSVAEIAAHKQAQYIELVNSLGHVGSLVEIPVLNGQGMDMIVNLPGAFIYTLVRPHPFEPTSLTGLMAALENLLTLALIVLTILHLRKPTREQVPFLMFSLSFVLILFTLVGLVTPVLGAVVRYKVPALPFLFVCLIFISKSRPFKSKLHQPESIIGDNT